MQFKCFVSGSPKPDITWYKNGKIIINKSGMFNIIDRLVCTVQCLDENQVRSNSYIQACRVYLSFTLQARIHDFLIIMRQKRLLKCGFYLAQSISKRDGGIGWQKSLYCVFSGFGVTYMFLHATMAKFWLISSHPTQLGHWVFYHI